jgi:hypothetical protein
MSIPTITMWCAGFCYVLVKREQFSCPSVFWRSLQATALSTIYNEEYAHVRYTFGIGTISARAWAVSGRSAVAGS